MRSRASDHTCKCGAQAAEWANLTGNFADVNDYEASAIAATGNMTPPEI